MTARAITFHVCMWLLIAVLTRGCVESAESVRGLAQSQYGGVE